ncbi:VanW family protein [Oscillochloris sp. ZM17-4]|uniref:VanW family protein n=1 Tax=Oscillochloris sp. ZM17-4 TaxID=2866714 RepID=UPI001C73DA73|nr:VanW family protein [Oscillochloris sp. ZM17-4]MBX0326503.1 VanW family protein [Oscillochloris sp. ZM17-4]
MHRLALLTVALILLVVTLASPAAPAVAAPAAQAGGAFVFYPQTGHNVGMQVKQLFDANGGLDIFGLPLTDLYVNADGLQVQYFERARFELRPAAPVGSRLSLTRLGAVLTEGRGEPAFSWLSASPDPARTFFPQSGHSLGGAFGWFWQTRGGLGVFGYPISEEFEEWDEAAGQVFLVQYFERARFEYHPENAGTPYEVQLGSLGRQLLERDPNALAAAAPARPVELLGQASTGFSTSAVERVTNISRATEMIDGYLVPQGAEFSFASVGDFSEASGFVDGYAIVSGRLEKVIGGGLCQVSTTLFRAVSNAGLQITRRVGHSHVVYFYENILGFDATVFTPSVDFRWQNDSPGPAYIVGTVDRGSSRMTFQIWGSSDGRQVSYDGPYTKNWTQPGAPAWQYDRTLPKGAVRQLVHGRSGVDVNYYRTITFADGTTRRNTYFTRYTPWEDFYIYGPGVTPPDGAKIIPPR